MPQVTIGEGESLRLAGEWDSQCSQFNTILVTPSAGCAPSSEGKCLEDGDVDNDCCAHPGTAACADGYALVTGQGLCHENGAVITCCKESGGTRERGISSDPLLDTLIIPDRWQTCSDTYWSLALEPGVYQVEVGLGDPEYTPATSGCKVGSSGGAMQSIDGGASSPSTPSTQLATFTREVGACGP